MFPAQGRLCLREAPPGHTGGRGASTPCCLPWLCLVLGKHELFLQESVAIAWSWAGTGGSVGARGGSRGGRNGDKLETGAGGGLQSMCVVGGEGECWLTAEFPR